MDYKYKFIIDTDSYAGNFEREMCAFVTGRVGECEVGEELAVLFEKDYKPFENVVNVADKRGCCRPCEIEFSPSKSAYCSVAVFFGSRPTKKQINLMKRRAGQFAAARRSFGHEWDQNFELEVEGFRLVEVKREEIEIAV